MRHEWIFDVLADMHAYATANDLPELALKVSEALIVARREIQAAGDDGDDPAPSDTPPGRRRVH